MDLSDWRDFQSSTKVTGGNCKARSPSAHNSVGCTSLGLYVGKCVNKSSRDPISFKSLIRLGQGAERGVLTGRGGMFFVLFLKRKLI